MPGGRFMPSTSQRRRHEALAPKRVSGHKMSPARNSPYHLRRVSPKAGTVNGFVQGVLWPITVDSGSEVSFIDYDLFYSRREFAHCRVYPSEYTELRAVGGSTVPVLFSTYLSVRFGDAKFNGLIYVVRNSSTPFLLGENVLKESGLYPLTFNYQRGQEWISIGSGRAYS